jgi:ABC-2 type transport system permease protein
VIFAVGSTSWLLAHEVRLARRGVLARPGMKWRAPVLLGVFLVGGLFMGVPAALALKRFGLPPTVLVAGIAALGALAVFTLMLSQSLAAATETLYARADLDLLFSSPISPRKVLFAKCAGIATDAFFGFAILATPVVLPIAILARPSWLAVYVVLAALALLATAAGIAIAIGLFQLIGPKRTRTVSQLLAVFIGAALFLVAQSRNLVGRARFTRWFGAFAGSGQASGRVHGPLSWPLRALSGEPAILFAVAVVACASFACAVLLVGRRFASDAAAASGAAVAGAGRGGGEGAFAGGLFRVTVRKELRLLYRDVPLLAQVLLRVVYLLPLMFILLRNVGDNGAMRLPMGVGAVAFMCGQVAGSLVWLTVAAEDAPELIGCAPASAAAIRRAKLCAALAPLAALMVVPLIVLTTLSTIAGLAATAGCAAAALVSALIGFALQKPAKRSAFRRREAGSLVASLAEFGAGAIIALTAGFAVVWPPLIAAPISVAALAAWALWRSDGVPRRALPNTQVVLH